MKKRKSKLTNPEMIVRPRTPRPAEPLDKCDVCGAKNPDWYHTARHIDEILETENGQSI